MVSAFAGISIYIYYDDHPPPHLHVRGSGAAARVTIQGGRVSGSITPRQLREVERWRKEHTLELLIAWQRASSHEPLHWIEGRR
jgi:hypothetical protein